MQYALLTIGSRRLLITRPDTSKFAAVLNMAASFHLARHLGVPLYIAPTNPAQLEAVWTLECRAVHRVRTSPLRTAMLLGCCRFLAATDLGIATVAGRLAEFGTNGRGTPAALAYFDLDLRKSYATAPVEIRLPDAAERDVRQRARALGLDGRTRIVTLHVREAGYKASLGYADREKDAARNADIDTYRAAIDVLVSRGYTVVRFGDPSMTPFTHPGVIDLATSPLRTPALEIWCVLHSRFFITGDSGPFNLGVLTGVPSLGVNLTELIGLYPLRPSDRNILKHVVDSTSRRELTLLEMLTPHHLKFRWAPGRFELRDNTADEIREAVEEMDDALNGVRPVGSAQRALRQAVADFLETDYGRKKQKAGLQPGFYLGDGWIGEAFAQAHLGIRSPGE